MSQIHENSLYFNYGFHLLGQAPMDDRTVWSSFEDIYVDGDNPTEAPMYNKVHAGMQVAIVEVDSLGNPNVTLLVLKDDSPYTPGVEKTVDETNYNYYWSVLGSDIYEKIEDATYFHNESEDPSTMKMLDKHGNLDAGTTLADLEEMTLSAILKEILFEIVIATQKNGMSASCSWNNYSTVQEVGDAMPSASNISYSFTPEVWHCVTSAGKEYATYDLNVLDEDNTKKYYTLTSTNTGGTDMSTTAYTGTYNYVDAGAHYFYVDVAYTAGDDAYDTNDNLRKEAYSGNIKTTPISFTGAYRIFSNAWATYTSASKAYANRGDETTAWDETAKTSSSLMNGTVTLYFKWPSDITTGQEFHIYVPQGYSITDIKAANNTSKDTYDLDATATKVSDDTVTISTTNGQATGEYIDYIVTRASGNTNVMVVFQ